MISAMPAVAIRRERSKSTDKSSQHPPMTRRRRFVEYYHRKIQRVGSIHPTARNYSTATTPENELPPELLVEVDPYTGKSCPTIQRFLGFMPIFHAGCMFIAAGLVTLFLSVGTIKADVTALRALGSVLVILGAILCFLRTIFFKKPATPRHRHVLRLRSSDSFATRLYSSNNANCEQSVGISPGVTMEMISELSSSPRARRCSDDLFLQSPHPPLTHQNSGKNTEPLPTLPPPPPPLPPPPPPPLPVTGLIKSSSLHLFPKTETPGGTDKRSPSPLLIRPTSNSERMLQSAETDEERSL